MYLGFLELFWCLFSNFWWMGSPHLGRYCISGVSILCYWSLLSFLFWCNFWAIFAGTRNWNLLEHAGFFKWVYPGVYTSLLLADLTTLLNVVGADRHNLQFWFELWSVFWKKFLLDMWLFFHSQDCMNTCTTCKRMCPSNVIGDVISLPEMCNMLKYQFWHLFCRLLDHC